MTSMWFSGLDKCADGESDTQVLSVKYGDRVWIIPTDVAQERPGEVASERMERVVRYVREIGEVAG